MVSRRWKVKCRPIMKGWGVTFLTLGVGSLVLPMGGVDVSAIRIFGDGNAVLAGCAFAVVGAFMFLVSLGQDDEEE
jgi:hypothetical protein